MLITDSGLPMGQEGQIRAMSASSVCNREKSTHALEFSFTEPESALSNLKHSPCWFTNFTFYGSSRFFLVSHVEFRRLFTCCSFWGTSLARYRAATGVWRARAWAADGSYELIDASQTRRPTSPGPKETRIPSSSRSEILASPSSRSLLQGGVATRRSHAPTPARIAHMSRLSCADECASAPPRSSATRAPRHARASGNAANRRAESSLRAITPLPPPPRPATAAKAQRSRSRTWHARRRPTAGRGRGAGTDHSAAGGGGGSCGAVRSREQVRRRRTEYRGPSRMIITDIRNHFHDISAGRPACWRSPYRRMRRLPLAAAGREGRLVCRSHAPPSGGHLSERKNLARRLLAVAEGSHAPP